MPKQPVDHPSATRNRQPIFDVLAPLLAPTASLLELASGNGTHGAFFCRQLPGLHWQLSEADPQKLAQLNERVAYEGLANLQAPLALDARQQPWPVTTTDVVLAINLIHIAPIDVLQAVMAGAAAVLSNHGTLVLYGPYKIDGKHTSPGNTEFDQFSMPANNQLLILSR